MIKGWCNSSTVNFSVDSCREQRADKSYNKSDNQWDTRIKADVRFHCQSNSSLNKNKITADPLKTKSWTENFLYIKAEAVKVPSKDDIMASQALIWPAYKTALSYVDLVNKLMLLKLGRETTKKRNPRSENDMNL